MTPILNFFSADPGVQVALVCAGGVIALALIIIVHVRTMN